MRDKIKDQDYYKRYLDYQYNRINKRVSNLEDSDDAKKQRILLSLTGYERDLLTAEFSAGASKKKLKGLLEDALNVICEYKKITYEDLLTFLSLSVMLNVRYEAIKLIDSNKSIISNDRLLFFMASYIENGDVDWDDKLKLSKEFSLLDDVFESDNKNEAISAYLDNWYDVHKDYAWYDSHLSDVETYCGYWSFETAAIAKILDLDSDAFADKDYYPQL